MSVRQYLDEIDAIRNEIKRNNQRNSELRKRYKVLEEQIKDYLNENEQYGMKYNNSAITVEDFKSRSSISKQEKNEKIIQILKQNGVNPTNTLIEQIQQSQKGDSVVKQKLKFKKIKQK
jgi:cell division septum initiation protein DivIVA